MLKKKAVLMGVVVLLMILIVISGCANDLNAGMDTPEKEFGVVEGRTRPPVENVEIKFITLLKVLPEGYFVPNETSSYSTLTNKSGRYSARLPIGNYRVDVIPPRTAGYSYFGPKWVDVIKTNDELNFILTPEGSNYPYNIIIIYFNSSYPEENQRQLIERYNSSIVDMSRSKFKYIYENSTRVLVDMYTIEIPFDKTVQEMINLYKSSEGVFHARKEYITSSDTDTELANITVG